MKLTGDLNKITTKRNTNNQGIELHLDKIEYLTQKKDGRDFQTFDYEDELEPPLVITGDRLALKHQKPLEEGELEFNVFDKVGEEYVLNENIQLELTVAYNPEEGMTILSSGYYAVTIPPKDFEQLKMEREKEKAFKNRKGRKKN
jgi:hypothetical protein